MFFCPSLTGTMNIVRPASSVTSMSQPDTLSGAHLSWLMMDEAMLSAHRLAASSVARATPASSGVRCPLAKGGSRTAASLKTFCFGHFPAQPRRGLWLARSIEGACCPDLLLQPSKPLNLHRARLLMLPFKLGAKVLLDLLRP